MLHLQTDMLTYLLTLLADWNPANDLQAMARVSPLKSQLLFQHAKPCQQLRHGPIHAAASFLSQEANSVG